ncbi:hypothetical protein T484DRAFT_1645410, partial [Baffinella frigidus]
SVNPPPSTLNPQPSTLNPQPSTLNPQPGRKRRRRGSSIRPRSIFALLSRRSRGCCASCAPRYSRQRVSENRAGV